jgi:(1->4)-alpha-D-glucan 1-alpha-D-glucosylmutase
MRWRRLNRARKRPLSDGRTVPDHNEEYLLYQTLVGSFPVDFAAQREDYTRRVQQYMFKAVHEAKVNLSWINPDSEYSGALQGFISRILSVPPRGRHNQFLDTLEKFAAIVGFFGAMNSLSQVLLKIASPGIPDVYQGTELWDFSLVDPDNRRSVDFELRRKMLSNLEVAAGSVPFYSLCEELVRTYQDGRIKMWVTARALQFRRDHPVPFQNGSYMPLFASGEKHEHVLAFARRRGRDSVLVAVPRLIYKLTAGELRPPLGDLWGDTELPAPQDVTTLQNVFTGEQFAVSPRGLLCRELFARFPVALLAAP